MNKKTMQRLEAIVGEYYVLAERELLRNYLVESVDAVASSATSFFAQNL